MPKHNFKIMFTQKAQADLEEIYSYLTINLFADAAAEKLMQKLENSIMRLAEFPLSCCLVLDEPLKVKGYRRLIVDNYMALYLVDKRAKQVVIMRILYGASNYQHIL
ncbi:MAG: type II toxin-antitoxin system RelE/ParE family toxin [Clostridia bacterium]